MSLIWSPEPRFYRPRFLPSRCRVISYAPPRWLWLAVLLAWAGIVLAAALPHALYNAHTSSDREGRLVAAEQSRIGVTDANGAAETPARHAGEKP